MDARTRAHIKVDLYHSFYLLSKTGHYTHNSVLIHGNSDYEMYDICFTRWPGIVCQSNIINVI